MTHRPIPEGRRRELAAFIPDLAEARRKLGPSSDAGAERQFWTERVLDIRKVSSRCPTCAVERLWLLRHAYLSAVGTDPIWVDDFTWPGFCVRTGSTAVSERWPLEPIPGAKVPPSAPPNETPKAKPTAAAAAPPAEPDECPVVIDGRVVKPGDTIYVKASAPAPGDDPKRTVDRVCVDGYGHPRVWFTNGFWRSPTELTFVAPAPSYDFNKGIRVAELAMFATPPILVDRTAFQQFHTQLQAAPTTSNLESTMNQTAQQAAASLAFDASNIVEVKTFVFGSDIATLDDDTLLNYVQSLTGAVEHLEQLNAKTPLAKLVTKIAQLKDAKAKIVELLGGAPVEQASPAVDVDETKPKRVRRTKAEIEADNAAQARAEDKVEEKAVSANPVPPAPPAARATETDVDDLDLDLE